MTAEQARDGRAEVQPAWQQLEALALAMRPEWEKPEWDPDRLKTALRAAIDAGWTFEACAVEVWRLIWAPDGSPAELRATIRAATRRPQPRTGPQVAARGREYARQLYDATRTRQEAGDGNQEGTG